MSAELPNDGGAAFPWDAPFIHERGISARDYFAAAALPAILKQIYRSLEAANASTDDVFLIAAKASYEVADAMIDARQQNGGEA